MFCLPCAAAGVKSTKTPQNGKGKVVTHNQPAMEIILCKQSSLCQRTRRTEREQEPLAVMHQLT